ncbi:Arylsulfatase J [Araneus ventricosus]|uniref:Arylsulfatase J n=1 Tax=Araneus ventricosus TaxID=182803 RepID=A0A4Y2QYI4_ARAVE|nr:Arylsulfatase J [Araneus ventricosus]
MTRTTPALTFLNQHRRNEHQGLQHFVILGGQASGLPLNETTMPQHFKKFDYETHMIGKWHLGYQTKKYTPTYRGFDSFFGYWNGLIDYYDHTYLESYCPSFSQPFFGLDIHDNLAHVGDVQGKYATHLFTEKAEEIIMKHDTSKPLFMYFAYLAAHSGNLYQKSQAPADVVSQFKYIQNLDRRIHAEIPGADIEVWAINCQQRKEPPISRKIRSGTRKRLSPVSVEWGGLRRDSALRVNGLPACSKIIFSTLSNKSLLSRCNKSDG